MNYEKIISQVKTPFNKGIWSQSSRLSSRYIIEVALRKRSRVLEQEREKRNLKEKFLIQSFCAPLIEVPKHECACVSIGGCKVLRSSFKIPVPIKNTINEVVSIDGSILFVPTSFKNYKEYQRLKTNNPKYYIMNEYLYVSGIEDLEWIKVFGVFEDPLEVEKLNVCENNETIVRCNNALKTDFKLLPKLQDAVVTLTIEEIVQAWNKGKQDPINNQLDESL